MEIPFDKQARTDFEWFGVDEDDLIGHFTTAGFKRLPPSVAKSGEDLRTVTDYFGNVGPVRGAHTVDHPCLATALLPEWKAEAEDREIVFPAHEATG